MAQPWSMRMPLIDSQGNFGSPGNDPPAAMRYTECRLAPLAMEMLRDIDEDTVDFRPNYDGRSSEPVVLPSRFPNLLVNGSEGIAVGMATKIPPHNLREVADGVAWYLDNFEASDEELLDALIERIKGPDFPTSGLIVGRRGISDAYRTGRGSIVDARRRRGRGGLQGRTCLVVTELPYQVNPRQPGGEDRRAGPGRQDRPASPTSGTSPATGPGQRLVIVLKRDAVAKVVLNNLYKHTQLQDTFGANMLALVDGVPRTLRLDQMIRYWVDAPDRGHRPAHPVPAAQGARSGCTSCAALLKAIDRIDEVIALIRARASAAEAQQRPDGAAGDRRDPGPRDPGHAAAQAGRPGAAGDSSTSTTSSRPRSPTTRTSWPRRERQRQIVGTELAEIVDKFGDDRRTEIVAYDGEVADGGPDRRGGRRRHHHLRRLRQAHQDRPVPGAAARRQGRRGAQLRTDDIVDHFFVTTTHHWILFFTNKGRVYRAKAYELPDAGRDARGQHVANLLAFQPDERIAEVLALRDYEVAPYLVLATQQRAGEEDQADRLRLEPRPAASSRSTCARTTRSSRPGWSRPSDDLLLVSKSAQAIRFHADDESLRPMGRATSGVIGMRFSNGDELLGMYVVRDGGDVLVATDGGYAKRTPADEYPVQGRGGRGVRHGEDRRGPRRAGRRAHGARRTTRSSRSRPAAG